MTTPAVDIDSGLPTFGSKYSQTVKDNGTIVVPYHLVSQGNTVTQWRARIRPASRKSVADKSGWRAPLPYSLTVETSAIHCGTVIETTYDTVQKQTVTDFYYDGFGCAFREQRPTFYDSKLIDRAVSSALLALKNQKVNFGVAFGEYKETAELVSSVVTRISKSVRAFRGKYPREWGQVVKNQVGAAVNGRKGSGRFSGIPNSWLELQYGWNPAMQDVNGACSALSDSASGGHPFRVHVKGRAKSPLNSVTWGKTTDHTASGLRLVRTGTNFCYVRLDYELSDALLAVFSSLGLTNPLEIVWELLPYSFVIDWFVPIGDWLRTMDADFGWRFLGGTNTNGYRYRTVGEGTVRRYDVDPSRLFQSSGLANSTQSVLSFARSVYTSSPGAGFPTVKNPMSAGHVANALSLLINAFR